MPMSRDDHETILNQLLSPELDHAEKTELLQKLRADHSTTLTDFDSFTEKNAKLEKENVSLVKSNSMLFRQAGYLDDEKKEENEEKKEFSETVTIEELVN